jgi:SAM-dependent methyltransferase
MTDSPSRRAVTGLYAGHGWPAHGDELLQKSLAPRSPGMLLEAPGWLGLGAGQLVLDAGCRDASHAAALTKRYGCRVVGVDLVLAGLPKGGAYHAAAATAGPVSLVRGDLQALPLANGAVDLVWCRDTLSCLPNCALALAECARALRPGGGMVLYAVFATERLEPGDRAAWGTARAAPQANSVLLDRWSGRPVVRPSDPSARCRLAARGSGPRGCRRRPRPGRGC